MGLILLQGKVGNTQAVSDVQSNAILPDLVETRHTQIIRVNSRAALLKDASALNVAEGDVVAAVGHDKDGTLEVLCIRNETAGTYRKAKVSEVRLWGWYSVALSVGVIPIGLWMASGMTFSGSNRLKYLAFLVTLATPLYFLGRYFLGIAKVRTEANQLLDSTPLMRRPQESGTSEA